MDDVSKLLYNCIKNRGTKLHCLIFKIQESSIKLHIYLFGSNPKFLHVFSQKYLNTALSHTKQTSLSQMLVH